MAFCDLHQLMDVEEDFLKFVVRTVMEKAPEELAFLEQYTKTPLTQKPVSYTHLDVYKRQSLYYFSMTLS